jgi:hypothetical protein
VAIKRFNLVGLEGLLRNITVVNQHMADFPPIVLKYTGKWSFANRNCVSTDEYGYNDYSWTVIDDFAVLWTAILPLFADSFVGNQHQPFSRSERASYSARSGECFMPERSEGASSVKVDYEARLRRMKRSLDRLHYKKNDRLESRSCFFMVHPGKTEGYRTFAPKNRPTPAEILPGISGSRSQLRA